MSGIKTIDTNYIHEMQTHVKDQVRIQELQEIKEQARIYEIKNILQTKLPDDVINIIIEKEVAERTQSDYDNSVRSFFLFLEGLDKESPRDFLRFVVEYMPFMKKNESAPYLPFLEDKEIQNYRCEIDVTEQCYLCDKPLTITDDNARNIDLHDIDNDIDNGWFCWCCREYICIECAAKYTEKYYWYPATGYGGTITMIYNYVCPFCKNEEDYQGLYINSLYDVTCFFFCKSWSMTQAMYEAAKHLYGFRG